jgi:hypothetical protein
MNKHMSIKHFPRPRIQRAFLCWFIENRTRFAVPIRLTKITAKQVELKFHNYPDCLSVSLSRNELNIFVEWQGEQWDTLLSLDAYLSRTPVGYKCTQCVPDDGESITLFPSREALWQDHLFNPFLTWANEKLAPARWLKLSSNRDRGATWAQLIRDECELLEPDRTLLFIRQLKRLDEQQVYEGSSEDILNWLVLLKPSAADLCAVKYQ